MAHSETLYEFFVRHNGRCTDAERVAIDAFARLMTDSQWRPSNPHLGGFMSVIEIGVLAHCLHQANGAEPRLTELVSGVTGPNKRGAALASELHVGALLTRLGGGVEFKKASTRHGVRTPDLTCRWGSTLVDVEVTRAKRRLVHESHQRTLQTLVQALSRPETASYAVFVACPLTENVLDQVVNAVVNTAPGGRTDVPHQWCVVAGLPGEGDAFVGGDGYKKLPPEWWDDSESALSAVSRVIGGSASAAVRVSTKVPMASYVDPIRGKADFPQRTGEHAFIIALDTSELPGANQRLVAELQGYFQLWPHVSAVLLQYPFFPVLGPRVWRCHLIRNPHAVRSLTLDWCDVVAAPKCSIASGL